MWHRIRWGKYALVLQQYIPSCNPRRRCYLFIFCSILALQGNLKSCKASFWALETSPYVLTDRGKLRSYIYNNKYFRRNSTSCFTLSSKSGRGVTGKWEARFPHWLASTSVQWLGPSTFECILVFLFSAQRLPASLQITPAEDTALLVFFACLSKQK